MTRRGAPQEIAFAVVGARHGHVHDMIAALRVGGARLVAFHERDEQAAHAFTQREPSVHRVPDALGIYEDEAVHLVVTATVPNERAAVITRALSHGKDVLSDKPAFVNFTALQEARRLQRETRRILAVFFAERLNNRATVRAGELARAGAIGRVLHTTGLGPHRLNAAARPAWFFDPERAGSILADLAAHQADQFLFFTNSTEADVVAAHAANLAHPEYPDLQDFGEVLWRGNGGSGYARVDWFTPRGASSWGDVRLTVLGTRGTLEVRKNVDVAGRPGADHLFVVDEHGERHEACAQLELPFARQFLRDVQERTETAMSQAHCFLACELALRAQQNAGRLSSGVPRAVS